MQLIQYYQKKERQHCEKCNDTGRYVVLPMPCPWIKNSNDHYRINKMMGKQKIVYCSCEWGKDLKQIRKQIENKPIDHPFRNLDDDEILKMLKPIIEKDLPPLPDNFAEVNKQKLKEALEKIEYEQDRYKHDNKTKIVIPRSNN